MMSKTCTALVLLLVGAAVAVQGSAIKGQQQAQPAQRLEEQQRAIKSPVQQHSDRSPKSSPAGPQAPVLESSKRVYNDESIRRSVSQQAAAAAPLESVVVEAVQPAAAPVVAAAQPKGAAPAPVQPASVPVEVQPQPAAPVVEAMKPTFVEQAAPKLADELPAQSDRSAPIKEEPAKVPAAAPSLVVVEQVVPAKIVEPLVPAGVQSQSEPLESADSQLMAKKRAPAEEPLAIEVPAPDPGLVLSEPIDSTTKLLIDLDEHVQKFLPAEDKQEPAQPAKEQALVNGVDYSPPAQAAAPGQVGEAQPSGKSSAPLVPYASANVENEPIVPPLPSLDKVEKASGGVPSGVSASGQSASRQANHQHQNQQQVITQLLDQLDSLQNRIQDTINQLVARRRYVMSALLRPMGTYVRRVRTNLERLQNRVNQLQAAAVSVGGNQNGQNRPGFVDAAAIETIRRRIDDISKRISDIVNRIRFSLTPTSAPLNSNGRK